MKTETKFLLGRGAVAGIIAGLFLGILLMIWNAAVGEGFWSPVAWISGSIYGVDVILGGAKAVSTGMLIHVVVSAVLGALFVFIFRPEGRFASLQTTRRQVVINGFVFGLVVWAIMTYAVLPLVNLTLRERIALMPAVWFFAHGMYGIVLGALPLTFRAITSQQKREVHLNVVEIRYPKAS